MKNLYEKEVFQEKNTTYDGILLYLDTKMEIDFEMQSLRGHKWLNYHSRENNKDMKSEPLKGKKCKVI